MKESKKKAKTSDKTSRALYAEALSGTPNDVAGQMPKANTFGKIMRNQRKGNHPPAPKSLSELPPFGIGDILTTTGHNFVVYDSASDHPDSDDRIIIFGTKETLDFLALCKLWFMDGTFSSGPALFEQMYTVHGIRNTDNFN